MKATITAKYTQVAWIMERLELFPATTVEVVVVPVLELLRDVALDPVEPFGEEVV